MRGPPAGSAKASAEGGPSPSLRAFRECVVSSRHPLASQGNHVATQKGGPLMTVQSPPPPGAPQPPKKGMGPLAWIGIGCGVIIVIGIIVMAAGAYLVKTRVVDPMRDNPSLAAAKL